MTTDNEPGEALERNHLEKKPHYAKCPCGDVECFGCNAVDEENDSDFNVGAYIDQD